MSYIQIENFGGKAVRGWKGNQLALEVYKKNLNFKVALEQNINSTAIYAAFFAGLVGNACVKNEEVDFTLENVSDWVDILYEEGRSEEIKKVCDAWEQTNVYGAWLKEFQEKVRAILEPEAEEKPKKKMKSISNGTQSISSPLVH